MLIEDAFSSAMICKRDVDKITRRSVQIAAHPFSSRKVPEHDAEDIREIMEASCYRIIYR